MDKDRMAIQTLVRSPGILGSVKPWPLQQGLCGIGPSKFMLLCGVYNGMNSGRVQGESNDPITFLSPRRIGRRNCFLPPFQEPYVQFSLHTARAFHNPLIGRRNAKNESLV